MTSFTTRHLAHFSRTTDEAKDYSKAKCQQYDTDNTYQKFTFQYTLNRAKAQPDQRTIKRVAQSPGSEQNLVFGSHKKQNYLTEIDLDQFGAKQDLFKQGEQDE